MRPTLCAVSLLLLLNAPPAIACEAGICVERLVPGDGDEVPTNARIWVFYDLVHSFDMAARLYDTDAAEVPATAQTFRLGPLETLQQMLLLLTPVQELQPGAQYQLVVTPEEDLCGGANTVSTFTTGDAADETPPSFAGIAAVDASYIADYSAGSNCTLGPPRHRYLVEGEPATDSVAYHLYEEDALVALVPIGPRVEGGGVPRPENVVIYDIEAQDEEIPDRCFVLAAVDIAGNERPGDEQCIEEPAGDDDDDSTGDGGGGDCSCSISSPARPPGAALLALALLARRSRR